MFFDIHSHILPNVDDGAKDIEESLKILELMKNEGITHVLATPHFYPQNDNLEMFKEKVEVAFNSLTRAKKGLDLPEVFLGTEMFYFEGMGALDSLSQFCLNNSKYILLELTDHFIDESLFEDILLMRENSKITPIIAHIERYQKAKKFKKFLKFLKEENIPVQVNTESFFETRYSKTFKNLILNDIATFIATDSHSVEDRKPYLKEPLKIISEKLGEKYAERFIENSQKLYNEICDINA